MVSNVKVIVGEECATQHRLVSATSRFALMLTPKEGLFLVQKSGNSKTLEIKLNFLIFLMHQSKEMKLVKL